MKLLTISYLLLLTSLLPTDKTCSDCSDCERFVAFMDAGIDFMKQKLYYKALNEFQAAQVAARVCGCTSTKPAALIKEAIAGLEHQRIDAEVQKNKALRLAKENEIQKNKAIAATKRAEEKAQESFLAAREARANLNALTAKDLAETEPSKALRLAEMNCHLYPQSQTAASIFDELISNTVGKHKKIIKKGHTDDVEAVAFAPDGQTILTGSGDNTAILWDLQGKPLQIFSGYTDDVTAVAFAPDGQSILTGSADGTAILLDLQGKPIQTFSGHTSSVLAVAFAPDGQTILTGSEDNTAILWDLQGKPIQTFSGHTSSVEAVAFAPDGQIYPHRKLG